MGVTPKAPIGQRFSHVYLDRGEPVGESARMRVRMRGLVVSIDALRTSTIVEDELGVEFTSWSSSSELPKFETFSVW